MGAFVVVLTVPPLGKAFDIASLGGVDDLLIEAAVIVWAVVLRWVWRTRLMERFLGLHWERQGGSLLASAPEDHDPGPADHPVL